MEEFFRYYATFLYAVNVNLSVSKIDYKLLKTKDEEYDSNYFVFKLKYGNVYPYEDNAQYFNIRKFRFEVGQGCVLNDIFQKQRISACRPVKIGNRYKYLSENHGLQKSPGVGRVSLCSSWTI